MKQAKTCVVPNELRGVTMHHSNDLVEVHHGSASGPLVACGFHWSNYMHECLEAARSVTK